VSDLIDAVEDTVEASVGWVFGDVHSMVHSDHAERMRDQMEQEKTRKEARQALLFLIGQFLDQFDIFFILVEIVDWPLGLVLRKVEETGV
jgi:hypothetical protein